MRTHILFGVLFFLLSVSAAPPEGWAEPQSPKAFAIEKMKKEGISDSFIQIVLESYQEADRDRILELNLLGFVMKADYSAHYSKKAIHKCREFLRRNRSVLRSAERRYHVEREAITALLWVETKHGKTTGKFPVASVYFNLLQADHPDLFAQTRARGLQLGVPLPEDYESRIQQRAAEKSAWALQELKALETIHDSNSKDAQTLKGSFSGAFGYSQFIPSSYQRWAQSTKKGRSPDLFKVEDAIVSVAHYLMSNGWKPNDVEAQRAALFHYNRSQGYGEVILRIASELKQQRN